MKTKLALWDFDGTLADTFPITFDVINDAIEPILGKRLANSEILTYFGRPDEWIVEQIVGPVHASTAVQQMYDALPRYYPELRLYDGVKDALEACKAAGLKLGLFTGRGRTTAHMMLEYLGVKASFSAIVTGSEVKHNKPDPEGPLKVCKLAGAQPGETVMLGDTGSDILAGKAIGAATVGCLWNVFAESEKIKAAQADFIARQPSEIQTILENLR